MLLIATHSASHMVLYLVKKYPEYNIVNLDKMDYCSSTFYFKETEKLPNYHFVKVRDHPFIPLSSASDDDDV